jgi:hypothetical protein
VPVFHDIPSPLFYLSGEKKGEVCGETRYYDQHFDLDVCDDTLIVAKYDQKTVQCYQLITE